MDGVLALFDLDTVPTGFEYMEYTAKVFMMVIAVILTYKLFMFLFREVFRMGNL